MRLITWRTLQEFITSHPSAAEALAEWRGIVENAAWTSFDDVRRTIPTAGSLGGKRVKFDIFGNRFRLICEIRYADPARGLHGVVKVLFVGTHAEYDRIDANTVSYRKKV